MNSRYTRLLIVCALLQACSEPGVPVELRFGATWGGDRVSCASGDAGPSLTDLRFYVHDVALRDATGAWRPLELDADETWQLPGLAMVDLEDGAGTCLNGTPEQHAVLTGTVPAGDYRGLRFALGVPFDRNHADPLTAPAPLDDAAMHWHWRSGYKFLRAGVRDGDDGFWLHLGSTGCEGTVQNITGCRAPNRVAVELPDFDPRHDTIVFDLQQLVAGTDLGDGVAGDCSSGPAETACSAPFEALGLDHESGEMRGDQTVFRRRAP